MKKELIKSVTHCPTCGSECSIGGDGETHYYISKQVKKKRGKQKSKPNDEFHQETKDEPFKCDMGYSDCEERGYCNGDC